MSNWKVCDMDTYVTGKGPFVIGEFDSQQEAEAFCDEAIETASGFYSRLYGGLDDTGTEKGPQQYRAETEDRYQVLADDDYQRALADTERTPRYVMMPEN